MFKNLLFFLFLIVFAKVSFAQFSPTTQDFDDDFSVGGDIFSDFNEDLEASQVMEDERFYRYARFFSTNIGLGATSFTGNRGRAYKNSHPSFHLSTMFFMDFQSAIDLGIEYSKHTMYIDTPVASSPTETIGAIDIAMLRPFLGYRYYIDTTDLGTAITYSNPYIVGRIEYWYQTKVYRENKKLSTDSGGGIGVGVGAGLEFPIEINKRYFNVELLFHSVNFNDKYTDDYRQIPDDDPDYDPAHPSEYGYDDLTGYALSIMCTYNISW